MYFQQADILKGLGKDFLKKLMDMALKGGHEKGDLLFDAGSPADHFYVLLTGCVKIHMVGSGRMVYTVSHAGEAFGWSSLIFRGAYSASAVCVEPTKVLKFNRDRLLELIDKNPADGMRFFQQLAAVLGNRLLKSYEMITSLADAQTSPSFGTGQTMDVPDAL